MKNKSVARNLIKLFIINLLGIILFFISIGEVQASNYSKKRRQNHGIVGENFKTLSASIVTPALGNSMPSQIEGAEVYPAYELYEESWNTDFLQAYAGITVPDSFVVDVSDFVMPIEGKVTSPYGIRGKRFHYGTDIKLQVGDTVRAAFDGKVRVRKYDYKGYGCYLVLRHPNGLETVYAHLSQFLVEQEQNVKAGEPIGLGGNTGHSHGSHLHFEFRFLGNAINPAEIIDFDEFCLKDNIYVYIKGKSGNSCINNLQSQYKWKSNSSYHQILQKDTLSAIAKKYGTTVDKLCKINKIKYTTKLRVGDSIRIL